MGQWHAHRYDAKRIILQGNRENNSGTDIDLFISLSSATTNTLKEIYNSLLSMMQSNRYQPKKQNVSINIKVNHAGRNPLAISST
jgi:hypothetical protein